MDLHLTVDGLSRYLTTRSDLVPLVNALHKGDIIGLCSLSESCHCLDDLNVEITAHQQEDDSYILNTPNEEASK